MRRWWSRERGAGRRPDIERVDRLDDPARLGVRPLPGGGPVPPFVERDRTGELAEAVRAGGFVLVVGDAAAGKTRLAYEVLRARLPGHACVVPGTDVGEAVRAAVANRPAVLWLDDLERHADALTRAVLADLAGRDVLVLATIRTAELVRLTGRGRSPGLLAAVTAEVRLDRVWSVRERAAAEAFAHDPRLASALAAPAAHGLAEHLAGGPERVRELTAAEGTRGAVLVAAAVDLRRAGYHRPVPAEVLRDLHEAYLSPDHAVEPPEAALRWATRDPCDLLVAVGDGYLAHDYLLDAAQADPGAPPVPAVARLVVLELAGPGELVAVGRAAAWSGALDDLDRVLGRAVRLGAWQVAADLADLLGDAGREADAVAHLERIVAAADGALSRAELLDLRRRLAWQAGEKAVGRGDPWRALPIVRDLVRDSAAELGAHHPETLAARVDLARQTGALGYPEEALALARAVVEEATAHLGPAAPVTLAARSEAAGWVRAVAGPAEGVAAFAALLDDLTALGEPGRAAAVDARRGLGGALADAGEPARAVEVLRTAVADAARLPGPAVELRLSYSDAVAEAGDPAGAARMADELAADSARLLGPAHPGTLAARCAAATRLAESGARAEAGERFAALLADLTHLPDDHWIVAEARSRSAVRHEP